MRRMPKAFADGPRLVIPRVLCSAAGVALIVLAMFRSAGSPLQIVLIVVGAGLIVAAYAMTIIGVRRAVQRIRAQRPG